MATHFHSTYSGESVQPKAAVSASSSSVVGTASDQKNSKRPPPSKQLSAGLRSDEEKRAKVKTDVDLGDDVSLKDNIEGEDALEDNPYGLREAATQWLAKEMEVLSLEEEQPGETQQELYRPYVSPDGRVPLERLEKSFVEYELRDDHEEKSLRPVLVAVGVKPNWEPDDESIPSKARFLLFPNMSVPGSNCEDDRCHNNSALFLTYMPGKYHGSVDGCFQDAYGAWILSEPDADNALNSGVSSGGKKFSQPDRRVYPAPKRREPYDVDPSNGNEGFSRLIWEVEYGNRDPVELRQHGHKMMMQSNYTRLFLGAKFSYFDPGTDLFEAAIVLWGRPEDITHNGLDNTITVIAAVSFGTKDLTDETKEVFSGDLVDHLPGVRADQWRRPNGAGTPRSEIPRGVPPPNDWIFTVPRSGILYKVASRDVADPRPFQYILRSATGRQISDLQINLMRMAVQFQKSDRTMPATVLKTV